MISKNIRSCLAVFETKLAENESGKLEPEPKGPIVEAPEQVKNEQEPDQRDMRSPVNVLAVEDDKHSEGAIGKKVEERNEEKRIEPPLLEVALPKKPEVNEEVSVQPSSISSQEAVALPKKPAVTDNINETKEAIDKSTINPTQDSSKQPAAETSPTSVNSKSADNYIRNKSRSRSRSGNRNDSHEPRKSNENRSWNRVSKTDARPNGDRLSPYNNRLKKDDSKFYLETKTNTWVFTRTDIYEHTPGVLDGIDPKQEMVQRAKGINFMVTVGSQLRVPQMTINAACTFFHRRERTAAVDVGIRADLVRLGPADPVGAGCGVGLGESRGRKVHPPGCGRAVRANIGGPEEHAERGQRAGPVGLREPRCLSTASPC